MKFYCRRCGNQIDLKRDRVEGKYLYVCVIANSSKEKRYDNRGSTWKNR